MRNEREMRSKRRQRAHLLEVDDGLRLVRLSARLCPPLGAVGIDGGDDGGEGGARGAGRRMVDISAEDDGGRVVEELATTGGRRGVTNVFECADVLSISGRVGRVKKGWRAGALVAVCGRP